MRVLLKGVPPEEARSHMVVGQWYLVAHPQTGSLRIAKLEQAQRQSFGEFPKYLTLNNGKSIYLGKLGPTELIYGGFKVLRGAVCYRRSLAEEGN
jgi:hypothetical protein